MLLFSTMFHVNDTMTEDDFISLVIEWNQNSNYKENIIPGMKWNGERNITYATDSLKLSIIEYKKEEIIAARFEKRDKHGVIWDTSYVMNFRERRMSVQLERSYLEEALKMDGRFSTPYFIRLLCERGYLQDDEDLSVSHKPLYITDENLELLASLMEGKSKYRLPVIFVSRLEEKDFKEIDVRGGKKLRTEAIYADGLAYQLKGVAHVLVEGKDLSDASLRKLSEFDMELKGDVTIYFPNAYAENRRLHYRDYEGIERNL